ncbi:hypothetical protein ABIE65_005030 [Constrictibacter sp. MBR-5]|jgi:hypothetical protein
MNVNGLVKSVVPVIIGVFLAGYIMNALRDNSIVASAIDGFDG